MSGWVAKVERAGAKSLLPDEKVIAATLGQAPGAFWAQVIGAGVGALAGMLALSSSLGAFVAAAGGGGIGTLIALLVIDLRAKSRVDDDMENEASQLPIGRMMVALTDQRMLFFHMTPFVNSPKQLLLEIDVDAMPEVSLSDGNKLVGSMTFTFPDQSVATTEVLKAGKPQLFADAVAGASKPGEASSDGA